MSRLIPHTISFLCSYKCNFKCTHCTVNAGPWYTQTLDVDYIIKTLDEAYSIPSIQVVVFTGGEPTLQPEHLRIGIKYASEHGFTTRMVTNAWWASSYKKAKSFLDDLYSYGLKELNISYDDFHSPWLNKYGGERNIINAARAGVELGLKVLIAVTRAKDSRISTEYLRRLLDDEGLAESVELLEDFIAPIGRGHSLKDRAVRNLVDVGCTDAGTVLTVHPDGKVVMCCGHVISTKATDMLTIGNVKTESLGDIIMRMQRNVLYWWIFLRGPHSILWSLSNEKIHHKCEACYLLGTKYKDKLLSLASKKEEIFKALKEWKDVRV